MATNEKKLADPLPDAVEELRTVLATGRRPLSLHRFGVLVGVTPTTVANWQTGTPPKAAALLKMAELAREAGRDDLERVFLRSVLLELANAGLRLEPGASEEMVDAARALGMLNHLVIMGGSGPEVERRARAARQYLQWRDSAPPAAVERVQHEIEKGLRLTGGE